MSNTNRYAPDSLSAAAHCPGARLLSSQTGGWRSVLLQTYEHQGFVEEYHNRPSSDHLFLLAMDGEYQIESWASRAWHGTVYRPGFSAWRTPGIENRSRWTVSSGRGQLLKLFIPHSFFAEAHEEYRRAGERTKLVLPDTAGLMDPVVFSIAKMLAAQLSEGLPDLCAEAGARALATHLIAKALRWPEASLSRNPGLSLHERQFSRVVEFIKYNFSKPTTLSDLASVAGVSPFHFARIFKQRFGVPPHRYLTRVRMQHAAFLLRETDMSVAEVALACGYEHQSHFAAAFRKHHHSAPTGVRLSGHAEAKL